VTASADADVALIGDAMGGTFDDVADILTPYSRLLNGAGAADRRLSGELPPPCTNLADTGVADARLRSFSSNATADSALAVCATA
jgi:hypothetical protein